jgi:hypothetical protein
VRYEWRVYMNDQTELVYARSPESDACTSWGEAWDQQANQAPPDEQEQAPVPRVPSSRQDTSAVR